MVHFISASVGNDNLHGGHGKDVIFGKGGSDALYGGRGKDTLKGNHGNDLIFGDHGRDTVLGGRGIDTCRSPKHAPALQPLGLTQHRSERCRTLTLSRPSSTLDEAAAREGTI
jgi:RTX calcium-binding nonapeptide repeat (4 copies)